MSDEIKTLIQALADAQRERDNYRKSYEYYRDECKQLRDQLADYKAAGKIFAAKPNGSEA